MNDKNADKVISKQKALKTVENNIKSKENGVFAPEIEFEGKKYPNTFTIDGKDVLGDEVKDHKEFKALCIAFKGNADYFDGKIATISAKNGRIKKEYNWDKIKEIKALKNFEDDARGQVFFYARALVLRDALKKELKELKN